MWIISGFLSIVSLLFAMLWYLKFVCSILYLSDEGRYYKMHEVKSDPNSAKDLSGKKKFLFLIAPDVKKCSDFAEHDFGATLPPIPTYMKVNRTTAVIAVILFIVGISGFKDLLLKLNEVGVF